MLVKAGQRRGDKANSIRRVLMQRQQNYTLLWRHDGHDGVSNHQPHDRLLNSLFGRRSKKTSKLRVTGFSGTGEFPAQMASNAEMFPFDDVIMSQEKYHSIKQIHASWHNRYTIFDEAKLRCTDLR